MGKNLIQQARGKGGPTYRAPSFRYKADVRVPNREFFGRVSDIVKCQGHSAPLMEITFENNAKALMIAPEKISIGDAVHVGPQAEARAGNTMPLKEIPEGTFIFNLEQQPGDGGKFVRAGGTFAKIITKLDNEKVIVLLPSKKEKVFNSSCRATIGVVSGGGRLDKPFLKAGKRYHKMRAKNKLYPQIAGTSQNAVDHPFGGKSSHTKGRPTQAPRSAPPGRKVGKIAPRRTGRRKGSR